MIRLGDVGGMNNCVKIISPTIKLYCLEEESNSNYSIDMFFQLFLNSSFGSLPDSNWLRKI